MASRWQEINNIHSRKIAEADHRRQTFESIAYVIKNETVEYLAKDPSTGFPVPESYNSLQNSVKVELKNVEESQADCSIEINLAAPSSAPITPPFKTNAKINLSAISPSLAYTITLEGLPGSPRGTNKLQEGDSWLYPAIAEGIYELLIADAQSREYPI